MSEIIFYRTPKGTQKISVTFDKETVWLSLMQISKLFSVDKSGISRHLKKIFESGELEKNSVVAKNATTASDGKTYQVEYYSLDAIIAVGYRVNSFEATQFRIWATNTLKEFIIKGFVLDDDRLKQGRNIGQDYFDELLERIREIRSSERRFYQKITDIYTLSIDYNKDAPTTKEFFTSVQNKLHWAITGKTAAEIIYNSADAEKINMGLTNWRQAPDGKILKSDVSLAKNYLNEQHIKELNRIVSAYLDLAENRAQRGVTMKMTDWIEFLHSFLELSNYPILTHKGSISALEAKLKAESEYKVFRIKQDQEFISDFDKEIRRIEGKE